MLNHGGQLEKVKAHYPDVTEPWLDLSTGIAPWSWPVDYVPVHVWQRLPESSEALCAAAAAFYGCEAEDVIAVAGTQVAIELLPECLASAFEPPQSQSQSQLTPQPQPQLQPQSVAIPRWGYGEHARCWARAGFNIVYYNTVSEVDVLLTAGGVQHVLVINPNNPSADVIPLSQLQCWQQSLSATGGYLVVDEAFADCDENSNSALTLSPKGNLVVMRSVGKFFGMAGLRLGFVMTDEALRNTLQQRLILWGVSNPAQWLGERMLRDSDWQCLQRQRIGYYGERLVALMREKLLPNFSLELKEGPLFVSLFGNGSVLSELFGFLVQRGILVRLFAPQAGTCCLRIGLTDEPGLERLGAAFDAWAVVHVEANVEVSVEASLPIDNKSQKN